MANSLTCIGRMYPVGREESPPKPFRRSASTIAGQYALTMLFPSRCAPRPHIRAMNGAALALAATALVRRNYRDRSCPIISPITHGDKPHLLTIIGRHGVLASMAIK